MIDSVNPLYKEEHARLREEISIVVKANLKPFTSEMWLGLVLMPISGIRKMAKELLIRV